MNTKLEPENYFLLDLIEQPVQLKVMIDSLIAGNIEGEIWVNSIINPESFFASVINKHYIFCGKSENIVFINFCIELLTNHLIPKAQRSNHFFARIHFSNKSWKQIIEEKLKSILTDMHLEERILLKISDIQDKDWRKKIPEYYELIPIDNSFFNFKEAKNFELVYEEVTSMWESIENFLAKNSFGYFLLNTENSEITSWCILLLKQKV